ncbi:FAD/NAD(P)-binding domain-containing protein [Parathielavia hyrcaniae]|uniref:FAD/NAD(P)-binding domain-containing protein n=1 Tax=Parathielavia hyrcaniae TaxID=113614 RepID=A0AAN6T474_9PEZI|nr:FAD/NAD(P)-binding domain-containing protein [Parathielavia hyrcaniae]
MADVRDMRIVIIGAGMGGLGTALAFAKKGFNNIHVFETASNLGFVGAGIQMPPNVVRVLDRLGCWEAILAESTNVRGTSIRQGSTNIELSHVEMPDIEEKYGFPHCTGHRSSLAGGLLSGCQKENAIKFHFSTALVRIDSFGPAPSVTLKPRDGDEYTLGADLILAADGIKSRVRTQMLAELGTESQEEDTGQAAYRIMLQRSEMEHDPEMLALLDSDTVVRWVGERRHIIAYPVSNKQIYNLSSAQPDDHFASATNATYTTRASKADMLKVYEDFCPLVQRMLNLVPDGEVCEWKLRVHKPLPTWVHGSVALLGDACHPTLPHLSQGAAMAIEDGAVLAEVVSKIPADKVHDPETVTKTLKVYELLRKPHCTALVDLAAHSGRSLHLGEGTAKEERDREFRQNGKTGSLPDKWASPDVQQMVYSHDWIKEANDNYERLFATL